LNVPLAAGEHRYVIRYRVSNAMSAGTSRDTLYWNSNSHAREVPIAEAILSVQLPAGVSAADTTVEPRVAGRGVSSPRRADTELERVEDDSAVITYRATHVEARQSLSVAITWPAGHVHAPKFGLVNRDRWLLAAPVALFLFYFIAWLKIGPEPPPGTVVTRL
jgi:hypothetical protein